MMMMMILDTTTMMTTSPMNVLYGVGTAIVLALVLHSYLSFFKQSSSTSSKNLPPMAPAGYWETTQSLSGDDFPWFLLRTAETLRTRTFRLALPVPFRHCIVVGDPQTARAVLSDPTSIKPRGLYRMFDHVSCGTPSLFSTNGPYWHGRRKGVAPAFASNQVSRMNEMAVQAADQWIASQVTRIRSQGQDDDDHDEDDKNKAHVDFDVGDEMIHLLLKSICSTAFEYDISDDEIRAFQRDFETASRTFLWKATTNPLLSLLGPLQIPGVFEEWSRAVKAARNLQTLALKMIDAYRKNQNSNNHNHDNNDGTNLKDSATTTTRRGGGKNNNNNKSTIIDLIMHNECYQNDTERAADILVMLVGGHDTTAYSLAWTLQQLALHPDIQHQLRFELLNQTSDDDNNNNNNHHQAEPQSYHKNAMLQRIVKEAIRLYPVSASGSQRECGRDFWSRDGQTDVCIPKGSYAMCCFILPLRDPAVFENPDVFDPDRWVNPTEEMNQAFLAFSLGPQNCVGRSLALAELHSILPRIIERFDLSVVEPGHAEYFLTLKPSRCILRATSLVVDNQ